MDLTDRSELIGYLKSNGLYTKHALGQNFLVDREVLDKIVETAEIKSDDLVIEVGPGLGVLTAELVKKCDDLVAFEIDKNLARLLARQLSSINDQYPINDQVENLNIENLLKIGNCKLKIICDDILKVSILEIVNRRKYKVVANIPYYITSKILQLFLTQKNKPESITLLVQKEVAERICARPGQMSTLSISVQAYAEPEIIDIVKASSFFPAPKVDSAILKISPTSKHRGVEMTKNFFRLVHIGFASKRKTLLNNLTAGYHLDKEKSLAIIKSVGLNENVRAQELSIEEWAELTRIINS